MLSSLWLSVIIYEIRQTHLYLTEKIDQWYLLWYALCMVNFLIIVVSALLKKCKFLLSTTLISLNLNDINDPAAVKSGLLLGGFHFMAILAVVWSLQDILCKKHHFHFLVKKSPFQCGNYMLDISHNLSCFRVPCRELTFHHHHH